MLTTTLNEIRSHGPCKDGWEKLLKHLGKTAGDDEALPLATILTSNDLDDALWVFRRTHPSARNAYKEAVTPARKVYDEAIASACKAYDEAIASARKVYEDAIASAWKVYEDAIAPAWNACKEACASARKAYNEARAAIFLRIVS
jgi:vacuolar-type H+-ATPase subunit H